MDDLVSILLQSLVASGTFALAFATYRLGRLSVRERKATQARALAERIYNPIRSEVADWEPERVYQSASSARWSELKRTTHDVVYAMPSELVSILDSAEALITGLGIATAGVW